MVIKIGRTYMGHHSTGAYDLTPTQAECKCGTIRHACPRHYPAQYADYMGQHATDSIGRR